MGIATPGGRAASFFALLSLCAIVVITQRTDGVHLRSTRFSTSPEAVVRCCKDGVLKDAA